MSEQGYNLAEAILAYPQKEQYYSRNSQGNRLKSFIDTTLMKDQQISSKRDGLKEEKDDYWES